MDLHKILALELRERRTRPLRPRAAQRTEEAMSETPEAGAAGWRWRRWRRCAAAAAADVAVLKSSDVAGLAAGHRRPAARGGAAHTITEYDLRGDRGDRRPRAGRA